jgi:transcriptional regulator of met regulon
MQKKRSAKNARFRAGTTGVCEAQLWAFTGAQRILNDDDGTGMHWVAAESLDAALRYMRQRHGDFTITEARFLGMIPLLSGSPLD